MTELLAISRSRRAPEATRELVASHDFDRLRAALERAGAGPHAAAKSAGALVRHVFGGDPRELDVAWDEATFASLGLARALTAPLLALDPRVSLTVAETAPAADGTQRLALATRDGRLVETVLIPTPGRTTVCVSSQVGCARACSFCETGRLGFERQLAAGEIVDQVRIARRLALELGMRPLQNVVFMGMGEPFDNLGEVLVAVRSLTDPRGFGLAGSRVTVSTVGVVDKLDAFFAGARAELAVSLNAPDDARRDAIMPINARWNMLALRDAIARALPPGRRVLFEYVLFGDVNDADADADLVADYVRGLRARVNVIPCNPGPDPRLVPPSPERLDAFVARLTSRGVTTLVRRPRGRDVGGACGQLAGRARAAAPGVTSTSSP